MFKSRLVRVRLLADRIRARLDVETRANRRALWSVRARFYRSFWEQAAAAVGATLEDLGDDYARILRGTDLVYIRGGWAMLDTRMAYDLTDNKPLVLRLMSEMGIRTPRFATFTLASLDRAIALLNEVGGRVVVKPADRTGAGFGVTTGVHDEKSLGIAARMAARHWPSLLVEEEISGHSYRLLYLDGELIDAVRRDPPKVHGDGRSDIRTLIRAENARRVSGDPVRALHPITIDTDCRTTLARQGLGLRSVPPAGSATAVKKVVNENCAADNHIVRAEVHPSIEAAGRRLAAAVGLSLAGVDVMSEDIGVPLEENGGCINEVNAGPGLHHHVLVAEVGDRAPVGAAVLEHIFSRGQVACCPVLDPSSGA